MAQRISRAKRTLDGAQFSAPADVAVVLRVLYLIFNEGYGGDVDLAAEAIRLTRMLAHESDEPEVAGLLALMLLHHARRAARTDADGALVPLDRQDRTSVGRRRDRRGRAHPAGRARRRPSRRVPDPGRDRRPARRRPQRRRDRLAADPVWYDELLALRDNPAVALSRAVAVGQVDGPLAGLRALDGLDERLGGQHRLPAVRAYLHERADNLDIAAEQYALAAEQRHEHGRARPPGQAGGPAPVALTAEPVDRSLRT